MLKEYIINNKSHRLNLFSKLRDKDDAYFIGYLSGGGAYHKKTKKRSHRMAVSSTDIYIIDAFCDKYQPDSDPDLRPPNDSKKHNIKGKKCYKNLVMSSKFSDCFKPYGIMDLKPKRTLINVSKKLMPFAILGLFDSDGSISWGKRKDRDRLWVDFKITHPSLNILNKISKYFSEELNISSFIVPKGEENCFVLRISKREFVREIFDFLYTEFPFVYNKFKYNSFKKFLKAYDAT